MIGIQFIDRGPNCNIGCTVTLFILRAHRPRDRRPSLPWPSLRASFRRRRRYIHVPYFAPRVLTAPSLRAGGRVCDRSIVERSVFYRISGNRRSRVFMLIACMSVTFYLSFCQAVRRVNQCSEGVRRALCVGCRSPRGRRFLIASRLSRRATTRV